MTRVSGMNLYNDVEIYKYRPGGFIQPYSGYLFSSSPYGKNVAQGLLFFSHTQLGGNFIMPLLGIAVNPDPGKLVVWRNVDRSGNFDPRILHSPCKVLQGHKNSVSVLAMELQQDIQCSQDRSPSCQGVGCQYSILAEKENMFYKIWRNNSQLRQI